MFSTLFSHEISNSGRLVSESFKANFDLAHHKYPKMTMKYSKVSMEVAKVSLRTSKVGNTEFNGPGSGMT